MVDYQMNHRAPGSLVDILDKVLDKGLVVAGDIQVSLANVELLTIKIRLLVCSIDKAQEIGLDWWRRDRFLSSALDQETSALRARIEELEKRLQPGVSSVDGDGAAAPGKVRSGRRRRSRKEGPK
jgi:hypothetical protein